MKKQIKRMIASVLTGAMVFTTFFGSMTPMQAQAADVVVVKEDVEAAEVTDVVLDAQEVTVPETWARLTASTGNGNGHFGSANPEAFVLSGKNDVMAEDLSVTVKLMSEPAKTRLRFVTKYVDDTHWGYIALEVGGSWGYEFKNGETTGWPTLSGLPTISQYDVFTIATTYTESGMDVTVNNLTTGVNGTVSIDNANFTGLKDQAGKVGMGAGYFTDQLTDLCFADVVVGETTYTNYTTDFALYNTGIAGQVFEVVSNDDLTTPEPEPEPEPDPEPTPDPNPNDDIVVGTGEGRAWWTVTPGVNNTGGHQYGNAEVQGPILLLDMSKYTTASGLLSLSVKPTGNWGIFYNYVDNNNWLYIGHDGSSGWYYQYLLNGNGSYASCGGGKLAPAEVGVEIPVTISLDRETLSITVGSETNRVTNQVFIQYADANATRGHVGVMTKDANAISFADVTYNGANCMADTWGFAASRPGQQARLNYTAMKAVTGTVSDGTNPIAGATVRIGLQSIKTDTNGAFTFEKVEVGTHTLTVTKGGFEAYMNDAFTVAETGDNVATVTLSPKADIDLTKYDVISNEDMKVYVGKEFPLVARYEMLKMEDAFFRGNETNFNTITINGAAIVPEVISTDLQATEKTYVLGLKDEAKSLDLTLTVKISIENNTLTWQVTELTKAEGCAKIATIDMKGLNLLTVDTSEEDSVFAGAQTSTTTTQKADTYITFEEGFRASDSDGYLYAFLSNGKLSAGLFSNSEKEGDKRVVRNNGADNIGLSSAEWYYEMGDATTGQKKMNANPERYEEYPLSELPIAKVAIADDINKDGDVDWNDGALAYRDIMHYAYGSENVKNMVNHRIVMNFASMAPNPFLATADNIKKVYLATDGLPQSIVLKGYGNEGHDSANSEYADVAVREGGIDDFQDLIKIAHDYNTQIGIHVNAQEIYPEAKSMSNTIVDYPNVGNGWGWLDQSHVIDKQWDLASQARWKRLVQLYDRINETDHLVDKTTGEPIEWPTAVVEGENIEVNMSKEELKKEAESLPDNMDLIYLDVWYQDAWETRRVAEEFNSLGWRFSTEFSAEGEYDSTWQHWSTDAAYGGATAKGFNSDIIRFIRNDQRDSQVLNYPSYGGTADNPLLGGYRLYGFEGWGGDKDFNRYIRETFNQNLPTRFFQHYIVTDWTNYEEGKSPVGNTEKEIKLTNDAGDVVIVTRKEEQRSDENIERIVTLNGKKVLEDVTYLLPWTDNQTGEVKMYHWNLEGGVTTWELTSGYENCTEVVMYKLTDQGRIEPQTIPVLNGTVTLIAEPATAYVVVKSEAVKELVRDYGECDFVVDPGFNGYEEGDKLDSKDWSGDITDKAVVVERSKNPSTGDQRLAFNSPKTDVAVSTTINGLEVGKQYVAEVNIQNDSEEKAYIIVNAGEAEISQYAEKSIIGNYVQCDPKNNSKMQRMQVFFIAESETAVLTLKREAGEGSTYVDDIRVIDIQRDHNIDEPVEHWSVNEEGQKVFTQDFEVVAQGLYPFVLSSAQGVTDPRTHLSQLNAPYTQAGWHTKVTDDVITIGINGKPSKWSLKHHEQNTGIIYQTIPQNFRFEAGKKYRVEFDYESGPDKAYAMVVGDGVTYTTPTEEQYYGRARGTENIQHAVMEVVGSSTGQTWIGLYERGSHAAGNSMGERDFILDNLVITEIGEEASVSLEKTEIYLGETAAITATHPQTTTWVSGDETVAKVDVATQTVKALKKGTTTLTATLPGGETKTFTITVKDVLVSPMDREEFAGITVTANTEEPTGEPTGGGCAIHAVDGNTDTYWHSQWSASNFVVSESNPAVITVDLSKAMEIGGFRFMQRNGNGLVHKLSYRALAADGTTVLETGNKTLSASEKVGNTWVQVPFMSIANARYIEISVLEGKNNNASMVEIEPLRGTYIELEKVAAPVANIDTGVVAANTEITLSAVEGASVYYTVDGTEPSKDSTLYAAPIVITENTTVKAIAVKEGYGNSTVVTYTYTIAGTDAVLYTVTFDSNDGSTVAAQNVTANGKVTVPAEPVKEGYRFLGWYFGEGEAKELFDFENTVVTGNITLKAQWQEIVLWNVWFDTDGAGEIEYQTIENGQTVVKPEDPEKAGYTFAGWYVGDAEYDFANPVSDDFVICAKWTVDKTELQTLVDVNKDLVKGNYTDNSWNTFKEALDYAKSIISKESATLNEVTIAKASLTAAVAGLKAQTLAPVANIGSGLVAANTEITLTAEEGASVYYTVDGTEPGKDSTLYTAPIVITENTTVKAIAVKEGCLDSEVVTFVYEVVAEGTVLYTVTFDSNGGSNVAPQNIVENEKVTVPAVPVKEGYRFLGWYVGEGEAKELFDFENTAVTGNITLKAEWEEIVVWTVTFDSNGGSRVKSVEVENGKTVEKPEDPSRTGYTFAGWFVGDAEYDFNTAVTENITVVAKWVEVVTPEEPDDSKWGDILAEDRVGLPDVPTGIWVAGIKDLTYNGTKQTQEFRVYDGNKLLVAGKDYTASIKNNQNVYALKEGEKGYKESKEPQVVLKMKGDYKGTKTITFKILPVKLDGNVAVDDIHVTYTGKKQTPAPNVTWNGKKLTAKDFYVAEYKSGTGDFVGNEAKKSEITLTLTGQGNFTDTKEIKLTIGAKGKELAMDKMKVTAPKKVNWDAAKAAENDGIILDGVVVKNGKTELVAGTDYTISYENNKAAGTATMILTGKGDESTGDVKYYGVKRVTFTINGTAASKFVVNGLEKTYTYTGEEIKPQVSVSGVSQDAYSVSYEKNVNKGTATMYLTGNPEMGYTGTKKVTFKIKPAELNSDYKVNLTGDGVDADGNVAYTAGGATPQVVVKDAKENELVLGVDYTVSYKNNKAVAASDATKAPTVVIKGKGNYAKSTELKFAIVPKALEVGSDLLTVTAKDKLVSNKAGGWKQSFKVYDVNGKALSAKDYDAKNATYYLVGTEGKITEGEGNPLTGSEILGVGSVIRIKVTLGGKSGNYEGTASGTYRIIDKDKDISKAVFKIAAKEYTGEEIELNEGDVTATLKKASLAWGTDYEVVKYEKNINKGTAKVTLRGIGNFGGEKVVSFKINQRDVVNNWWEAVVNALFK